LKEKKLGTAADERSSLLYRYAASAELPSIDALVLDTFDRCAPMGTGYTKLGGNYCPVFRQSAMAKEAGYPITLHLDSVEHKYVDEFSNSNVLAIKSSSSSKATLVVPESATILRSVTKLTIVDLARRTLGWDIDVRKVMFEEIKAGAFQEFMAAGTAAVSVYEEVERLTGH
jgi:branched-chain amino acid aminotransferase